MPVWQREARLPRVVECCAVPPRDVVAAVALRTESPLVDIVARVARIAGTAFKTCVVRLLMTVGAGEPAVSVRQRKARHGKVVEIDRYPGRVAMTFAALRAVPSFVNVIGEMTVDTLVTRAREVFRRMTAVAAGCQVSANQVKCSNRVVEVGILPTACYVAGPAFDVQGRPVHIIRAVAARAV